MTVTLNSDYGEENFHFHTPTEAEDCFRRLRRQAQDCTAVDGVQRTIRLVLRSYRTRQPVRMDAEQEDVA